MLRGGSGGVVDVVSLWGGLGGVCCVVSGSDHHVVLSGLWNYEGALNACHAKHGVCGAWAFPG